VRLGVIAGIDFTGGSVVATDQPLILNGFGRLFIPVRAMAALSAVREILA
jgi:hypothetical protein